MSEFITHYELGLTNDDFDFEIINIVSIVNEATFRPQQILRVRVNERKFDIKVSMMVAEDMVGLFKSLNYSKKEIKKLKIQQIESIKFESILKYLNSTSQLRKRKLEKINQLNGN